MLDVPFREPAFHLVSGCMLYRYFPLKHILLQYPLIYVKPVFDNGKNNADPQYLKILYLYCVNFNSRIGIDTNFTCELECF